MASSSGNGHKYLLVSSVGSEIKGLDRRSRRKDSGGKEPASDEENDREDR